MSSIRKNRVLSTWCAAASIGLVLCTASPFPSLADDDVDNWIQESGAQSAAAKPSVNEVLEKNRAAMQVPIVDHTYDQAGSGRKIAQSMPRVPVAAPGAVPHPSAPTSVTASPAGTPLLKGQVTYCIPRGTPLKLKLATVPMPAMKMDLRDDEGNLKPAQLNEEITAKITEDIYVDDNKVIPEGTVFYGRVSKIIAPRHVGREGHLEISFDKLATPDGRVFKFEAEANNYKESTNKSKLKGAGRLAAHTAGGAALGALIAYKAVGGWQNTVAMHGYNVAGGAAVGAVCGLAYALWKRGPNAVLEPGDEFNMSIDTDLLIPAASKPTPKPPPISLPGFEVDLISKKVMKDDMGMGLHKIRIDTIMVNHTRHKLSSIDLFLEDDLGNRFPVSPDEDEESEQLFYLNPISQQRIVCSFVVQFPKLKHKLIWLDHVTHRVIFEQKLR